MNRIQEIILQASSILILLMLIFPPYVIREGGKVIDAGYAFFLKMPNLGLIYYSTVNSDTLSIQIFGILAITGLLYFAFGKK